jgi:hypothetical protein
MRTVYRAARSACCPTARPITFRYIADHSAYGFHSTFADGSPDHTSPHRPGYRFADTSDAARLAADEAYEQRRERMHYTTNRRRHQQDANEPPPTSTRTLDELRAKAEQAWEERNKRMANAWRNRGA